MPQETRRPITPEDLFAISLVSDPQVSPDGTRAAYVVTRLDQEADDYRAAIWIAPLDGGEPTPLTAGTARDTNPRWSPDGTAIVFLSNRPAQPAPKPARPADEPAADEPAKAQKPDRAADDKPKNQLWLIPVGGGEARQLTWRPFGASAPTWSPDGQTIAFLSPTEAEEEGRAAPEPIADERIITTIRYRFDGRGFFDGRFAHLWTVPTAGGEPTRLTGGDADDSLPTWSPDGALIAFSRGAGADDPKEHSTLLVVPAAGGEARAVTSPRDVTSVFGLSFAWSPDGARLALVGQRGPEAWGGRNATLWTVGADGSGLANHTAGWDRAFGDYGMSDLFMPSEVRPVWSPDGRAVYALASDAGATNVYRVELTDGRVHPVTSGARRVAAFQLTPDGGRIVFAAGEAHRPFELFVADVDGRNERQLTDHSRAFLAEVALSPAEEIRFPSRGDGREIQGWILTPPDFVGDGSRRYPLVIQIHGGPHFMYGHAMFHEMQLMAARGYVVLFTNPRGSAGYGEEFTTCTRGIWGEADMPDIVGALDAILARGFVDPARVGVTGGSYGGYLTNWLIGHGDRFAAAVTQRSVTSFVSMYGTSDIGFNFGEHEFGGTPWDDRDRLVAHSPLTYVADIRTPLLIIHNEQDLRCPIEQAEQLFVSLKRLGREVAFVRIPGEDHNLSRAGKPSRRLARLHHLIGWFDRHLERPVTSVLVPAPHRHPG